MNRVVLIGNGFDKAHEYKTSYQEFLADFWNEEKKNIIGQIKNCHEFGEYIYNGKYFTIKSYNQSVISFCKYKVDELEGYLWYKALKQNLPQEKSGYEKEFIENEFLIIISENDRLKNWVDIEEEYYKQLIKNMNNLEKVKKLNAEFELIKDALIAYLKKVTKEDKPLYGIIHEYIYEPITNKDMLSVKNVMPINEILLVNFNYTQTAQKYMSKEIPVYLANIHGQFNSRTNPIIFGYSDEKDEDYRKLEKVNENELLQNIKSSQYFNNGIYRKIMDFLEKGFYQVSIMGHSCGISDKTFLSKVFEHNNCRSIKIFYYQENENKDNFSDISINISRNFSSDNKDKMREIIIPKNCSTTLTGESIKIGEKDTNQNDFIYT